MSSRTAVTIKAPAKVNLGLWVGRRRPDGFHDIVTIMVPLTLCDTVVVAPASGGITLAVNSPEVPDGHENIACKAASLFFAAIRSTAGCAIRITKRIPVGAGLGGGSSDAAAVLKGLNRLFGSPLTERTLHRLALRLGSDVPFFLKGVACACRGRGERLRPLRLPHLHFILHLPSYPVSTPWAYAALDRLRRRRQVLTSPPLSPKILSLSLRQQEPDGIRTQVHNSFEPVVFRRYPDLKRARDLLLNSGALAAGLSGSGSTVYGLVDRNRWQDPMAAMTRHGFFSVHTSSLLPAA
ncbi:MAG: 4-(cytidine 5'-diphospho)-2-C-methyl-D-erythritol kinase [candidate division WOR-3 bacterium]